MKTVENIRAAAAKWLTIKTRMNLYTIAQVMTIFSFTSALVGLNKPEIMPVAAGFGSIFVFYSFSRKRKQYDDAASFCSNQLIALAVKYDRDKERFREEALHLTFNLHAVSIRRLAQACKVKTNFPVPSDQEVDELEEEVNRKFSNQSKFVEDQETLANNFLRDCSKIQKDKREYSDWSYWIEEMEGLILIYIALVAAFGSKFVSWWHSG